MWLSLWWWSIKRKMGNNSSKLSHVWVDRAVAKLALIVTELWVGVGSSVVSIANLTKCWFLLFGMRFHNFEALHLTSKICTCNELQIYSRSLATFPQPRRPKVQEVSIMASWEWAKLIRRVKWQSKFFSWGGIKYGKLVQLI